jgi:hypothetical protein
MEALKNLGIVVSNIKQLLSENFIKDENFNNGINNIKKDLINHTLVYLNSQKKNYLLNKIDINENIQNLYKENKEPNNIDLEYDKKYKVETKIEEINKLIEIIKDL